MVSCFFGISVVKDWNDTAHHLMRRTLNMSNSSFWSSVWEDVMAKLLGRSHSVSKNWPCWGQDQKRETIRKIGFKDVSENRGDDWQWADRQIPLSSELVPVWTLEPVLAQASLWQVNEDQIAMEILNQGHAVPFYWGMGYFLLRSL